MLVKSPTPNGDAVDKEWIAISRMSTLVKVKQLHPEAVIPQYAHDGDSGFDLVAVEDVIVEPGQTVKVPTGLAFELLSGCEMQIRPRSGITSKTKLRVQLGTVDSSYRGEVSVVVDNVMPLTVITAEKMMTVENHVYVVQHDKHPAGTYIILRGDRIAQGVIVPVIHAELIESDELDDSERGTGGFGSTGVSG